MDYDMIAKLTVVELKTYLRLRGLKLSGRKQGTYSKSICCK